MKKIIYNDDLSNILKEWELRFPKIKQTNINPFVINILGWIIGKNSIIDCIEILYGSKVICKIHTDKEQSEINKKLGRLFFQFNSVVCLLETPPHCKLRLEAVDLDKRRIPLCELVIERPSLKVPNSNNASHFQPLMITAVGRSGTTWLMHLLSKHPDINTFPMYPYECRIAEQIITVYKEIIKTDAFEDEFHQSLINDKYFQIMDGFDSAYDKFKNRLSKLKEKEINNLFKGAISTIDRYYSMVESNSHKNLIRKTQSNGKRYFAEKNGLRPEWLFWEIYPGAKEIFLVRDFRDMICSALAFNAKRGIIKFGRQFVSSDREFVHYRAAMARPWVLEPWYERADRAHLVRYEKLVLEPQETLSGILNYLGSDSRPEVVSRMLEKASLQMDKLEYHQTSTDPQESIGRWKSDLDGTLQKACNEAFKEFLEAFGYESNN